MRARDLNCICVVAFIYSIYSCSILNANVVTMSHVHSHRFKSNIETDVRCIHGSWLWDDYANAFATCQRNIQYVIRLLIVTAYSTLYRYCVNRTRYSAVARNYTERFNYLY